MKIDWIEVLIVVVSVALATVLYELSWRGLLMAVAMCILGYVSGDLLLNLWRRK